MSGIDPSSPLISDDGRVEIAAGVYVSHRGLRIQFSRGGGPGGQNVNKLNTKAELWIQLAEISGLSAGAIARLRLLAGQRLTSENELHLVSQTQRTQEGNRREIFERLRELVTQARKEPRPRRKTRPTGASRRRRLDAKRRRSEIKARRRGQGE